MERVWDLARSVCGRNDGDPADEFVLESRNAALAALRSAVASKNGPVLLTGDAGTGKTWLWNRLRLMMPAPWRWVSVDLSPANHPAEIYRLIGHALGLPSAESPAVARLALGDYIEERSADGDDWVLVVDEVQSVTPAVLDEIRILANRLGRSDGFASLILVGQTSLASRLRSRPFSALTVRLATHVHLRPVDLGEARQLVERLGGRPANDPQVLERLHRDSGGIPQRLVKLAQLVPASAPRRNVSLPTAVPASPRAEVPRSEPERLEPPPPPFGAGKPPILDEEGLIEVGWDATSEPEGEAEEHVPSSDRIRDVAGEAPISAESDEAIQDRYAALQAWSEWARNQGRALDLDPSRAAAPATASASASDDSPEAVSTMAGNPSIWADARQGFAPYSQLFSRLKQSKDKT
jgi:general secretion pathway protein A